MNTFDLTECESEPICHPGLIQPHGCLLAAGLDGVVTHATVNLEQYVGVSAVNALGKPLHAVLGPRADRLVSEVFKKLGSGPIHQEIWEGVQRSYSLWIQRRGAKFILEWEQAPDTEPGCEALAGQMLSDGLAKVRRGAFDHVQAQLAAELTSRLTAFDRVMVYRFHPDWSGEVIAEVRHPRAEPFLGLFYPASDIPPQARQLYAENLLRVLADVNGAAINIISVAGETTPLDLTMSRLRALSPYHIEYLKNMKVGATATASLMCHGKLWGLIACHHDRRKTLSPAQRHVMSQIAETLSRGIETCMQRAREMSQKRLQRWEAALAAKAMTPATAFASILFGPERLRNLVKSCGMGVWSADRQLRMGQAAAGHEMKAYAARLLSGGEDIVGVSSRAELISQLGFAPSDPTVAGLMAIVVSREPALILFLFRPEAVKTVTWGGDTSQPVLRDERTGKLSPRRSFAQYKETVAGKAAVWSEEDMASARIELDALHDQLGGPGKIAESIEVGYQRMRGLIADQHPLHNSLLDAIDAGISLLFRSDSDAPVLCYANQGLLDLAGLIASQYAAGSSAEDLLEAIGVPVSLLRKCESETAELAIPTASEGNRHYRVEKRLALEITEGWKTVSLSALVFTDTTRADRAREAFLAAREKAKHLAQMKTSFLANMSHEIRTPLNGILGMVQLLEDTDTDAEQRSYLNTIQRSGDMLLAIINNILDLSKIEAGHVELEKLPFDLFAVVEGIVDLMQPRAHEKSIGLFAEFETNTPRWFEGDPHRLRQVLMNLVGNAVKFTAKGEVAIRVRCQERQPKPALVTIAVADSGIGIREDQQARVFDKFQQADESTTRMHGGTGLGLAIARELAALMGGTISLASELGVGSTFTVTVPLARTLSPQPVPRTLGAAPRLDQRLSAENAAVPPVVRRILVAEDDITNQIVIQGMLARYGFQVEIADSGLSALDLFREHGCDLILMDCQMPKLDGYGATKRIREMEGGEQHTPIIALTASAMPEDRQRCLDAGMDDFLTKPIGMDTLLKVLTRWNCAPPKPVHIK